MKGNIEKRGDRTYRIRLHLGYDRGKRITHQETYHGTKKEAEAKLRDLVAEFERGSLVGRSKKSLNEFLGEWLETKKSQLKGRTHSDYADLATRYLEESIGPLPLDKITALTIQKLYNELASKLSALTVRRVHTVVNQALKQAVSWRLVSHNPAADVQLPRHKARKVNRSLELQQAKDFLQATVGHRLGAAFRFAAETGCRPQEYCALTWSDIDFQGGRVQINKAMTWPKGGGYLVESTKTQSSDRVLTISPTAIEDLKAHRIEQIQQRLFAGPKWTDLDLVFPNSLGKPMNLSTNQKAYKAILEKAGLPSTFRPYDLRHTQATMLLQGGESPKIAQDRLGHSSITLTMDTYSHVLPGMQAKAGATIDRLFHGVGHRLGTKGTKQGEN